jgi:predicted transcriptional regulator YdeE
MANQVYQLEEIKLVGLSTRTSNALEMNPETAQIGRIMTEFFTSGVQEEIQMRKNPGTIFAIYTNYESDANGEYTYFLGQEVSNFDNIPNNLETLTIPKQSYVKFTSEPGPMPNVCINMWQDIWKMTPVELGGKRAYIADFEIYDARSSDPMNTVLDIYIGIEKSLLYKLYI